MPFLGPIIVSCFGAVDLLPRAAALGRICRSLVVLCAGVQASLQVHVNFTIGVSGGIDKEVVNTFLVCGVEADLDSGQSGPPCQALSGPDWSKVL